MLTNERVEEHIVAIHDALKAAEIAHPASTTLASLHAVLKTARDEAIEHFGLDDGVALRSGGHDDKD